MWGGVKSSDFILLNKIRNSEKANSDPVLAALHHVSPEGDDGLCPRQLAAQGVLVLDRSQQVSLVQMRQRPCVCVCVGGVRSASVTECFAPLHRWVASGGDNNVCSCCETSCQEQRRRRFAADAGTIYRSATPGDTSLNTRHREYILISCSVL